MRWKCMPLTGVYAGKFDSTSPVKKHHVTVSSDHQMRLHDLIEVSDETSSKNGHDLYFCTSIQCLYFCTSIWTFVPELSLLLDMVSVCTFANNLGQDHNRSLLVFPVCVIIFDEDSLVVLLESIMLISSWRKDSLNPTSRCIVMSCLTRYMTKPTQKLGE